LSNAHFSLNVPILTPYASLLTTFPASVFFPHLKTRVSFFPAVDGRDFTPTHPWFLALKSAPLTKFRANSVFIWFFWLCVLQPPLLFRKCEKNSLSPLPCAFPSLLSDRRRAILHVSPPWWDVRTSIPRQLETPISGSPRATTFPPNPKKNFYGLPIDSPRTRARLS